MNTEQTKELAEKFIYNKIDNGVFKKEIQNILNNDSKIQPYDEKKFNTLSYKLSSLIGKTLKSKILNNDGLVTNQDLSKITFFADMIDKQFFNYLFEQLKIYPDNNNLQTEDLLSIENKKIIAQSFLYDYSNTENNYRALIDSISGYSMLNQIKNELIINSINSTDDIFKNRFDDIFPVDILFENKKFSFTKQKEAAHEFKKSCLNRIILGTIPKHITLKENIDKCKNNLIQKSENFRKALNILCINNTKLAQKEMENFVVSVNSRLQSNLAAQKQQHNDPNMKNIVKKQTQYYKELVDSYFQYSSQYIDEPSNTRKNKI